MAFHTYDVGRAEALEDPERFRHCSAEELREAIGPHPRMTVADLGSGTGFYTDVVAPVVRTCYAIDVQEEMHDLYREKGIPGSVELVTAEVGDLPFEDATLDAAFSTMTFHEFGTPEALAELRRVVRPGGRIVTVDWTAEGAGESGPPNDERYDLSETVDLFESAEFRVTRAETRRETLLTVART